MLTLIFIHAFIKTWNKLWFLTPFFQKLRLFSEFLPLQCLSTVKTSHGASWRNQSRRLIFYKSPKTNVKAIVSFIYFSHGTFATNMNTQSNSSSTRVSVAVLPLFNRMVLRTPDVTVASPIRHQLPKVGSFFTLFRELIVAEDSESCCVHSSGSSPYITMHTEYRLIATQALLQTPHRSGKRYQSHG